MARRQTKESERSNLNSARSRLARNVRLLLAQDGWNQLDLAREAGLSQGMISQLLAGQKGVRLSTLDRVAAALRVDVGALFSPAVPNRTIDAGSLDAAVRSAMVRISHGAESDSPGADHRGSLTVGVDPDELREIGLAIGRAIVEATRGLGTTARVPAVSRTRSKQSRPAEINPAG
jgi:transcriptional regulator with XRE-family HTH domain